ncbi:endoplasmic reticulum metallopeptidase 1-like isoform X1 [Maniola jurtina]|uniref:endoplasmic reticulum metallopeptidase 1-like isoform X1 n=1 Tax=Maniola jurtina TaxID=191418 RepID=UPI001E68DD04|nr:endoplasmic reticulum metallopeptidase 1-like isoform X1 [Maniola jurtina]XP_045762629.1 endoplasmic reticulum metallopeptidase 1-like isoform X1 [Maniola jurtina]
MAVASSNKQSSGLPYFGINDHGEKPSQWISSKYLVILFGFFLLLAFVTIVIENDLPYPTRERDISKDDADTFSEESARKYLEEILGNQPRVSGTVYHFVKTRDLKELVDSIARFAKLPVHTDWQYVDGDYWLASVSPHVNVYQNLSNIIAVLEGESGFNRDGTTGTSILVNCHYDSVPFAMGASDNGVFCAIMAETLSKLSRRKNKLKHNIIFLFNGAEENVLLGSHGFLSHPWAKGVISVINLDSAGMNGKPNVFQVTDPRVLEIYRKTSRRPTAQGMGEFLFSTGIIPSDTDFRIWRDFGNITGIDIAFIKWGNVYHTRNDKPELIKDGVIQNAGDMLLNLVREAADCQELNVTEPVSTAVYFDYLGLFLLTYSKTVALVLDVLVGLLGLLTVGYFLWLFGLRWSSMGELLWSATSRVVCAAAGLAAVALCTAFMIAATKQMRYLSEHWIVVPFYWVPYLVASVAASHAFEAWRSRKTSLSRSIRTSQAMSATRLLISLVLLVLCCFPSLSNVRYLITTPLLVMSVASVVTMSAVRYGRIKALQHLLLEILLNAPATMIAFSLASRFNSLLIPIMGRSAAEYPDAIIAAANAAVVILAACTVSGIELLFSRRRLWTILGGVSLVSFIIMLIPFSPYRDENTIQRHYWFHTQITSFDLNSIATESVSGVFITKLDVYNVQSALSAIKNSDLYLKDSQIVGQDGQVTEKDTQVIGKNNQVTEKDSLHLHIKDSDLKIIDEDCDKLLYCDMPMFRPRFEKLMKNSLFVKMGPPAQFTHSLKLIKRTCVEDVCSLSFQMDGPAHNAITIWPRQNVNITSWSFNSPLKETLTFQGRPVYTIIHSTGTYTEFFEPLIFTLNLIVSNQTSVLLDISHHAHKIHHPDDFIDEYRQLLEVMPEYFNIATFLSFKSNYVF